LSLLLSIALSFSICYINISNLFRINFQSKVFFLLLKTFPWPCISNSRRIGPRPDMIRTRRRFWWKPSRRRSTRSGGTWTGRPKRLTNCRKFWNLKFLLTGVNFTNILQAVFLFERVFPEVYIYIKVLPNNACFIYKRNWTICWLNSGSQFSIKKFMETIKK